MSEHRQSIGRCIRFSLALATTTDDIGTALILLPLGFCHCCGRLVQEDFVCVVDDVWLSISGSCQVQGVD